MLTNGPLLEEASQDTDVALQNTLGGHESRSNNQWGAVPAFMVGVGLGDEFQQT